MSYLIWTTTLLLSIATSVSWYAVDAGGLGNQFLWTYDTSERSEAVIPDKIFAQQGVSNLVIIEDELAKVIRNITVDVVSPGKHLTELMNKVSTKTRTNFLNDYEGHSAKLDIGSTSRPMLYAYLGLELASPQDISTCYQALKAHKSRIIESCRSLVGKRKSVFQPTPRGSHLFDEAKELTTNKLSMAHLVFQNNVNLFMLDNYLLLCIKIEPELMNEEFPDLKLSF